MEDEKLKMLFSDFKPEMSSELRFMDKLQRNLDTVELIRQRNVEMRSRCKKAVVIASFVGFIVGCLFSLSLPYLSNAMAHWQFTLPAGSVLNVIAENFTNFAWVAIAATSILAATNAYEVSISLLRTKHHAGTDHR